MIDPVPRQGKPAGVVTRMIAAVLDGLVVLGALLTGYAATTGVAFMINPLTFAFPRPFWLLSMGLALAVAVGYLTTAWAIGGRTYGALFMGLRVVGPTGRPLHPGGALARAVLCVLFPVGLLWCAVNRRNRSLSDLLLRTEVIYDWSSR